MHTSTRVTRVEDDALETDRGDRYEYDEVLWVTNAGAAAWLEDSDLKTSQAGLIEVKPSLESVSHKGVFAAGDVADVLEHPREKAGVFAVRQGKPLTDNLRRALVGEPLKAFAPQSKFLSLISL